MTRHLFTAHRDVVAHANRRSDLRAPAFFALAAQSDRIDEMRGRPRALIRQLKPEILADCDACDWWTLADTAWPRTEQRIAS
jgi:hypothetical protein